MVAKSTAAHTQCACRLIIVVAYRWASPQFSSFMKSMHMLDIIRWLLESFFKACLSCSMLTLGMSAINGSDSRELTERSWTTASTDLSALMSSSAARSFLENCSPRFERLSSLNLSSHEQQEQLMETTSAAMTGVDVVPIMLIRPSVFLRGLGVVAAFRGLPCSSSQLYPQPSRSPRLLTRGFSRYNPRQEPFHTVVYLLRKVIEAQFWTQIFQKSIWNFGTTFHERSFKSHFTAQVFRNAPLYEILQYIYTKSHLTLTLNFAHKVIEKPFYSTNILKCAPVKKITIHIHEKPFNT